MQMGGLNFVSVEQLSNPFGFSGHDLEFAADHAHDGDREDDRVSPSRHPSGRSGTGVVRGPSIELMPNPLARSDLAVASGGSSPRVNVRMPASDQSVDQLVQEFTAMRAALATMHRHMDTLGHRLDTLTLPRSDSNAVDMDTNNAEKVPSSHSLLVSNQSNQSNQSVRLFPLASLRRPSDASDRESSGPLPMHLPTSHAYGRTPSEQHAYEPAAAGFDRNGQSTSSRESDPSPLPPAIGLPAAVAVAVARAPVVTWRELLTDDGQDVYYFNDHTHESTWDPPSDLILLLDGTFCTCICAHPAVHGER
jgi:hypothetical protein